MSDQNWKRRTYGIDFRNQDKTRCMYCGTPFTETGDTRPTKDHVKPKENGGILSNKNKVLACASCNGEKSNLSLEEWHTYLRLLNFNLEKTIRANRNKMNRIGYIISKKVNGGKRI